MRISDKFCLVTQGLLYPVGNQSWSSSGIYVAASVMGETETGKHMADIIKSCTGHFDSQLMD